MTEIAMPRLSDSMEQGTILVWLKADGDLVAEGDDLLEIETDKATMTYPSPGQGVLSIIAETGSTLAVGEPIASLAAEVLNDRPSRVERSAVSFAAEQQDGAVDAQPTHEDLQAAEVRATPLARRFARIHGVKIGSLTGSGPRGRVVRRDVATAAGVELVTPMAAGIAQRHTTTAAAAPGIDATASIAVSAPPAAAGLSGSGSHAAPSVLGEIESTAPNGVRLREPTRLQQVVARRMAEAQATVPDFQVETEVAMDAVLDLRAQLKHAAAENQLVPSINDIIVKACALALRSHPLANASYREQGFELHDHINVGIAVAAEQALLVPTITAADSRSLGSIASEAKRLSERVRNGTVTPAELSDGTFTVSNLGMFGMTAIKPVVNMPQAAILGVGALRSVLARDAAGEIVDRSLLTITLSCDHRILYGADAALFLAKVKALLEAPMRLVL
jgi:pyruvate dehydrogenase E2 component (dihydrolipoamide acetyltransferase)